MRGFRGNRHNDRVSTPENVNPGDALSASAGGRGAWRPRPWQCLVLCLVISVAMAVPVASALHRFLYGGTPVLPVGASPGMLAVSPDGRTIYLADSTDSITPVSAATGKAGQPIPISGGSANDMVISPDGRTLFTTVSSDNVKANGPGRPLARVDLRTGREAGQVGVPGGAADFVMSRDGKTLYVMSDGYYRTNAHNDVIGQVNPALFAVNASTGRIERRIPAPPSLLDKEQAMLLSPGGGTLYLADGSTSSYPADQAYEFAVTPVNLRTGAPGGSISIDDSPTALAITPDGRTLDVATSGMEGEEGQTGPNAITVIDTATGRVRATLPWKAQPMGLVMAPTGKTVWVVSITAARESTADNTITPVSVASDQAGPSFRTSGWLNYQSDAPLWGTISPDGRTFYVTVGSLLDGSGLETFRTSSLFQRDMVGG